MEKMHKSYKWCKNQVRVWISSTIFLLMLGVVAGQAYGFILPVKLGHFDTYDFGATSPTGIALNTTTEEYAIVCATTDEVYIVDAAGVLQWQFDIGAVGCNNPTGIAYNSVTNQYVITDSSDDELYVFDANNGDYDHQEDISAYSISPMGITYNSATDQYAICDNVDDEVYIVDAEGVLEDQFDTADFGSDNPSGISYNPTSQVYAILDYTDNEVYIVSATPPFELLNHFDTYHGMDCTAGQGITWLSENEVAIVSSGADEVYVADVSGELLNSYNISGWGCADPTGLAFIYATQQVAITDAVDDAIYFFDLEGNYDDVILTSNFGSTSPQDIAFNPKNSQFAIIDNSTDTVYLIDSAGTLVSSFPVGEFGCINPTGISYDYETNEYMITDANSMVVFTDTKGNLLRQFATGTASPSSPDNPTDIVYLMSSGNFAISDASDDEVYIVNAAGKGEMSFDTANFSATNVTGIDYDRDKRHIYLVDSAMDAFFILDMPKVHQATTATGTFRGTLAGSFCALRLRVTDSQGFCGGHLFSGGVRYETPGYIGKRIITLSLIPKSGAPYQYQGTVPPKCNMIIFPDELELGTLRRVLRREL